MRSLRLSRDVTAAVNVLLIVLIAVLMVSASTVVILIYQGEQSEEGSSDVVAVGQTIKVNYIGKLLDGRVFDTSLLSVANDDAAYPKSLSFAKRSNSSYTPLSFEVGAGKMITGFDAAVVGMKIGESKTVTLTPDEAYGDMDPSKLVTFQLTETVPLLLTFNASSFKAEYGVDAAQGLTVYDPLYGWEATVYEYDTQADRVTVKNVPTLNALYHIYGVGSVGWDVKVTGMDSNANLVTVEHQLDDEDSDMIKGSDGTSTFFIIDVDEDSGTAVRNYNTELLGKSLVFTITIVSIVE
ncbi:MAG: FKBP-type peptidyl-prolyl cis-trans isomerase [Methanomassiliicoccales archaeon PtaB.Bin215]|nr:MAG: FKBP-type peptidyl-prolyl cis-trans isomerase [Methanomassiliicoccales archaeon PtaB.Bin215]